MVKTKKDINSINEVEEKNNTTKKKTDEKTKKEETKTTNKKNSGINKINTKEEALQIVEVLEATKDKVTTSLNKAKNNNPTYLFCISFLKHLKEDKLYFLSLIITILFLCFFSVNKLENTAGYYDKKQNNIPVNSEPAKKEEENQVKSDVVDVTGYVGIYSREITLTTPLKINGTCSIEDYKLVYEIKSNKNITKYLVNDCIGTIKIWSDTLAYVSSGGARYISANNINFLFSASSMKEVDAETYRTDDEITSLKENKLLNNIEIFFYNNNFIILSDNDLALIKGSSLGYLLSDNFNTKSDSVPKTVFKTTGNGTFKFIAFSDANDTKCLLDTNDEIEEKDLYKIYSVKYNIDNGTFNKEKEILTRKNTEGCSVLNEDIATLSE